MSMCMYIYSWFYYISMCQKSIYLCLYTYIEIETEVDIARDWDRGTDTDDGNRDRFRDKWFGNMS